MLAPDPRWVRCVLNQLASVRKQDRTPRPRFVPERTVAAVRESGSQVTLYSKTLGVAICARPYKGTYRHTVNL